MQEIRIERVTREEYREFADFLRIWINLLQFLQVNSFDFKEERERQESNVT